MIQILGNSINTFLINKSKKNYLISFIFAFIFLYIFLNEKLENKEVFKNAIENLFTFSSIFSAIIITFIISKIFQIRNEKRELKGKIIILSNKVTDLRRICEKILSNYDVWDSQTKSKLENKYKNLTYQNLYDDYQLNKPKELVAEFLDERDLKGAYFYLALRDLIRRKGRKFNLELYGDDDEDMIYPLETIKIWYGISCANAFFYYLDHKYQSYKNSILIDNLTSEEKREIENLGRKINREKFQDRNFDISLLVDIGNHFENEVFPKLYDCLAEYEEPLSESVIYTLNLLFFIIFFGVFIPLFFPFLDNYFYAQKVLTFICTIAIIITFINFLLDFKKILKKEIIF